MSVKSEATAISQDMRDLYNSFKNGNIDREAADTLANISGKNLKAISIMFASEVMEQNLIEKAERKSIVSDQ
jgi:hypothetical protein